MSLPRPLRILRAAVLLLGLAALARGAEPPLVAIPPASLIGLNSAQSAATERIALDAVLREQTLALANPADSTAAGMRARL
jgi:hypothetical protein